jgi:hypothetical protein
VWEGGVTESDGKEYEILGDAAGFIKCWKGKGSVQGVTFDD